MISGESRKFGTSEEIDIRRGRLRNGRKGIRWKEAND